VEKGPERRGSFFEKEYQVQGKGAAPLEKKSIRFMVKESLLLCEGAALFV